MPHVSIHVLEGASREQKTELVKTVTEALVRILDKKPEHTHIVIHEIQPENWGFAGHLTDEWIATRT